MSGLFNELEGAVFISAPIHDSLMGNGYGHAVVYRTHCVIGSCGKDDKTVSACQRTVNARSIEERRLGLGKEIPVLLTVPFIKASRWQHAAPVQKAIAKSGFLQNGFRTGVDKNTRTLILGKTPLKSISVPMAGIIKNRRCHLAGVNFSTSKRFALSLYLFNDAPNFSQLRVSIK